MMKSSGGGGEIVQVHGGHILRPTGTKDRHSKVYTAKGPRDRRVRLSANTAIQFYDVQDRLGYDRPSKALDWLINKAKTAIDKLAELPHWNPNETSGIPQPQSYSEYEFQLGLQSSENPTETPSELPHSMDAASVLEGTNSFLSSSLVDSSMNFHEYPTLQNGDLCLSLHTSQDPSARHMASVDQMTLFSGSTPVSLESMAAWNGGLDSGTPAFSQRRALQSSFWPSFRGWDEPPIASQGHFGFQVPARFPGDNDYGFVLNKPFSSSSNSQY